MLIVPSHQITLRPQVQVVERLALGVGFNPLHFGSASWASQFRRSVHCLIDASSWPMFPKKVGTSIWVPNFGRCAAIMRTQFRRAVLPRDLNRLVAFDHKVFRKSDWFTKSDWKRYESYWMIVDGIPVGCCAFEHHVDFQEDHGKEHLPLRGSLHISTTGILLRFQGKGFGRLLKSWQIAYARLHGFTRIVTNHRPSNRRMIVLNKKFGFKIIRRQRANYYEDPPEPTIVMELKL